MAWGMGSVYLRLKKRYPDDKGTHLLQTVEVEKDWKPSWKPPRTLR